MQPALAFFPGLTRAGMNQASRARLSGAIKPEQVGKWARDGEMEKSQRAVYAAAKSGKDMQIPSKEEDPVSSYVNRC